jgi:hypothetical protein
MRSKNKVKSKVKVARHANKPRKSAAKSRRTPGKKSVALLSGGNPQIAKADGNAPVQAYINAMPGWKRDVDIREGDELNEAQMADWVKQAAALPGFLGS